MYPDSAGMSIDYGLNGSFFLLLGLICWWTRPWWWWWFHALWLEGFHRFFKERCFVLFWPKLSSQQRLKHLCFHTVAVFWFHSIKVHNIQALQAGVNVEVLDHCVMIHDCFCFHFLHIFVLYKIVVVLLVDGFLSALHAVLLQERLGSRSLISLLRMSTYLVGYQVENSKSTRNHQHPK